MSSSQPARTFISITGLSGSGKTTLAKRLAERLDGTLVQQDWMLIPSARRSGPGVANKFDFDEGNHVITELYDGRRVSFLGYSQETGARDRQITLVPSHNLIVEGVLALHIPVVRDRSQIRFWIDTPLQLAEARQLARWRTEGWPRASTREEALQRIRAKRVEEVPIILAQRPSCDLIIDSSSPLQRVPLDLASLSVTKPGT